jgi:hypothetical protein
VFHLARRFFGYVNASPPTAEELDTVHAELSDELFTLFLSMSHQDQRHAIDVAVRTGDDMLTEAALLHDVGKSVAPLGAITRSCATVSDALSLPVPDSWDLYLRHGEIGAIMLEAAGAAPLTVAFARFHPGPTPDGIIESQWLALAKADDL